MKMPFVFCLPSILLLLTCGLPSCRSASSADALNRSALHDPPLITLSKGRIYHFSGGDVSGDGQTYHSDYSYQCAFLLGLHGPLQAPAATK